MKHPTTVGCTAPQQAFIKTDKLNKVNDTQILNQVTHTLSE